jgi:hypothetical protein
MVITSAVLGGISWREVLRERKRAGGFMAMQRQVENKLGIGNQSASESVAEPIIVGKSAGEIIGVVLGDNVEVIQVSDAEVISSE